MAIITFEIIRSKQNIIENMALSTIEKIICDFSVEFSTEVTTWPRRSSARTQPADQISIDVVYSVAPNISSGAR
jgi:hypothetical protein